MVGSREGLGASAGGMGWGRDILDTMGLVGSSARSALEPPQGASNSRPPEKPRHRPFKKGIPRPVPSWRESPRVRVRGERLGTAIIRRDGAGLGDPGCLAELGRGLVGASGRDLACEGLQSAGGVGDWREGPGESPWAGLRWDSEELQGVGG